MTTSNNAHRYQLHAKVLPLSRVLTELPAKTRRYRLVLIDESHNLRNIEGKRWRVIRDYIERNDSLTVLLSATPYNKTYLDLAAQLGLFLNVDADIGIRPEKLLAELGGEHEFIRRHQCSVRTLAAFEKSDSPDDWRDLMRLYMVRRTRGFIVQNYAKEDERGKFLLFPDGRKSYFPKRIPKNLSFKIDDKNPADPYARFYSDPVVSAVNALKLPRYGLGNYLVSKPHSPPTQNQTKTIGGLSRAGTRLMGFCRTNLFKRLESCGPAFILSVALPDFVQTGMHDLQKRMFERRYNLGEAQFASATGERGTLPTETWREYDFVETRAYNTRHAAH